MADGDTSTAAGTPGPPVRPAPVRTGLRAGRVVIVSIAAAGFSAILGQSAFAPFLPLISASLDTSVALLGQAPGISMLVAGLLGLIVGPLADRYGQRRALVFGLLALAASALGIALSYSYLMFLVVMLVSAIGRATILPVAMAIGGTRFVGEGQRRALSWLSTGMTAATILGIPFLTTIGEYLTWRGSFVVLAGIALLAALMVWRGLGPDPPAIAGRFQVADLLAAYSPIVRHRPTVLFLASSLIGNIGQWNVFTYAGAYWTDVHQLTLHEIGLAALAQGIGGLFGSWLMSTPLGRMPPRRLLIVSRIVSGSLFCAPFIVLMPTGAAVVTFTLAQMLGGMVAIATTLQLTRDVPTARATALTLNGAAWSIGIAIGAASGGLALVLGGYEVLGTLALSTFLIAAGLLVLSDRVVPGRAQRSSGPARPDVTP